MSKSAEDHRIDPAQLDELANQIRKLSEKSEEAALGPITLSLTVPDRSAGQVSLIYEIPAIGDYTLRARISHTSERYAFITQLSGIRLDFDQIRRNYSDPDCEHCGPKQARKTTYLLKNSRGEVVQVGSSCLTEFLGHSNPRRAMVQADLVARARRLIEAAGPNQTGEGVERLPTVEEFLAHVLAVTDEEGEFVYRLDDADGRASTAELAIQNFRLERSQVFDRHNRRAWVEVRPTHHLRAKHVIPEFLESAGRQGDQLNPFDRRLVKAIDKDVVCPETQGLVATLFQRVDGLGII